MSHEYGPGIRQASSYGSNSSPSAQTFVADWASVGNERNKN